MLLSREECAVCIRHGAKLKLCAQIMLSTEDCAEDMGQKPSYAVGRAHESSCEWWGVQKARSDASDIVQQRRLHEESLQRRIA